ncbi:hypothetical protein SBRCBS47491_008579 [Sporothrix bragantina]|uniref:Alpha/beta hydrolase fold-3 domain-containing protein n=1 Tax=Sporothrix bragantina TaxID=671064 RepID=A0ABP0CML8_9PEZI
MKGMRSKSTARGETATLPSLETEVKLLPDGESSILWIGNRKKAAKYVLFFHGGGYVVPLLPGHMEWCWRVFVAPYIGTQNEVAVAVLDYTLCPEAQHPTQLNQAIAALDYLISSGIRPDQILIGGDSAGGNLTAHLLSHLGHPDANVSPPLKLSQPLLGAFLVSPWMSQDVSQRSVTENTIDMLTAKNGRDASRNFYGDKYRHVNMLDNKSSAFDGMTSVVSNVYVTAGQQEALRDQAVLFVDILRRRNPSLEIRFEIAEKEAHDFILLEGEDKQTGDAMERMKAWASDLIH